MERRARSMVLWPGMTYDIRAVRDSCVHCNRMFHPNQLPLRYRQTHCSELQKKVKLAWGSCKTRAALDRVLLYSETKDESNE